MSDATTDVTETESDNDEVLGEGGIKALRATREELANAKKANAATAARAKELEAKLAEFEKRESDKLSESEKATKRADELAEKLAKFEQKLAAKDLETLRVRVAAKHGVSVEDAETFLTGNDEETLSAQAERLAALAKPGNPKPDRSQGARGGTATSTRDAFAQALGSNS